MPRYSDADSSVNRTRSESRRHEEEVSRSKQRKQKEPKKRAPTAIQQIRQLQNSTALLIPRRPFCRLVRELLMERCGKYDVRVQSSALEALQEAAEIYLTQLMEDAYRCTLHRNRVTLDVKDIQLARLIRGIADLGSNN